MLLKKQVRGGVLLYALFMAGIFTLLSETYACAVVAATIGECGICGWIRTNKDKRLDRKWQKEDEKESQEQYVPDINVGNKNEEENL